MKNTWFMQCALAKLLSQVTLAVNINIEHGAAKALVAVVRIALAVLSLTWWEMRKKIETMQVNRPNCGQPGLRPDMP